MAKKTTEKRRGRPPKAKATDEQQDKPKATIDGLQEAHEKATKTPEAQAAPVRDVEDTQPVESGGFGAGDGVVVERESTLVGELNGALLETGKVIATCKVLIERISEMPYGCEYHRMTARLKQAEHQANVLNDYLTLASDEYHNATRLVEDLKKNG